MDLASSPRSTRFPRQGSPSCGPNPERSLGFARLWAAAGVLVLACSDFRTLNMLRNHALVSAFGFTVYSLLVPFQVRKLQEWPGSARLLLHCMDVVFVVLVAFLARASEASLFLLFLFVLVASARRWGPRQVLWTAGVSAILLSGALFLAASMAPRIDSQEAARTRSANVSLMVFAVFATGLLWEAARMDARERRENSARAAQRVHAQISRDLHDGVIQCLYAIEYRLEKLTRSNAGLPPDFFEDLSHLQRLVKRSQMEVRELVVQGRPLDLGPKSFLEYVADLAAEFERETGIAVRFISDGGPVSPPPAVAGELVRIVQEALLNVKKHSGARNVSIGFVEDQGNWRLLIDDDGRGFDFAGRLSMMELEAKRQGPYVIRERVSTLGGDLEIESMPGRGAHLDIVLPKYANG